MLEATGGLCSGVNKKHLPNKWNELIPLLVSVQMFFISNMEKGLKQQAGAVS